MTFQKRFTGFVAISALALSLSGCKEKESAAATNDTHTHGAAESEQTSGTKAQVAPKASKVETKKAAMEPKKPAVTLKLASVGNELEFDKKELSVTAGERVKLVFHNNATLDVMSHNWVLVKPGTVEEVAAAGMAKGEAAGFVDPGPDILAHSSLAKKGETVEVTFTAPKAGTYPYVCTVNGHYVTMKGKLVSKAP